MAARKLGPVDLGYCFFCASRGVEHSPMEWMQANKPLWIAMAQDFMRLAGIKQ